MRCKRHPSEKGVGVCAPCLRERLLALLADQADDTSDHRRETEPPPPPPRLQFPRRRSADPAPCRLSHVFFSTPRVGPSSSTTAGAGCWRRGSGKSSILSSIFGLSRTEKTEPDPGISETPRSSSWLSVLFHHHRKKKKNSRLFVAKDAAARKSCHASDRGMSPDTDCSASGNECASESSSRWWRSPPSAMRRPAAYQHHHRSGGLAGFAVFLSPLMRVSPGHRRSQEAAEGGFSGELRSTLKPHHRRHVSSGASSLGPSRSRKLVDFGRFR